MVLEKMQEKFTKYEIARILGARSLQLAMDAPVLLKIDKEKLEEINYDVLKIAEMEFEEEVLPITVKRPFPKKTEERVRKISKEEIEEVEEKTGQKPVAKEQEEKREEAEDRKVGEKEKEEEEEIVEEGEIMELAQPVDELEEADEGGEEEGV